MRRRACFWDDVALRWAHLLHPSKREGGFSLLEVVVALGVFGIVASTLAGALVSTTRPILLAKQRSVATAVAQQLLEQARALNYSDVGLVAADTTLSTATDSNLTGSAGSLQYGNEDIVFATNTANHPFNPHYVASFTLDTTNTSGVVSSGSTKLTRWVWVTMVAGQTSIKRVTVRVQFANPAVEGGPGNLQRAFVRASTLISPAKYTDAGVPLASTTAADAPKHSIRTIIAGNTPESDSLDVGPPTSCAVDCGLTAVGVRNQLTCQGRTLSLDHTAAAGGTAFGGTTTSTLADDDPATDAATTQRPSPDPVQGPSGTPNSDIYMGSSPSSGNPGWLVESTLPSSTTCLSTVLGTDGSTGGADPDLPYQEGAVFGPPVMTLEKNFANVTEIACALCSPSRAGAVDVLQRKDMYTSPALPAAKTTNTVNPANTVTATSTVRTPLISALALRDSITVPSLVATYGLIRVEPITIATSATGQTFSGGTAPCPVAADVTDTSGCGPEITATNLLGAGFERKLRVWLYDPANQLSSQCTSRSSGSQPANYCIIDHDVTSSTALAPVSLDETVAGPQGIVRVIRWVINLSEGAPLRSVQSGSRGTTWKSQVNPLVATIGMCIAKVNVPTCTPNGALEGTANVNPEEADIAMNIDLGTIKASATYGFPV